MWHPFANIHVDLSILMPQFQIVLFYLRGYFDSGNMSMDQMP